MKTIVTAYYTLAGSGRWRTIHAEPGGAWIDDPSRRIYLDTVYRCNGLYNPVIEWAEPDGPHALAGMTVEPWEPYGEVL